MSRSKPNPNKAAYEARKALIARSREQMQANIAAQQQARKDAYIALCNQPDSCNKILSWQADYIDLLRRFSQGKIKINGSEHSVTYDGLNISIDHSFNKIARIIVTVSTSSEFNTQIKRRYTVDDVPTKDQFISTIMVDIEKLQTMIQRHRQKQCSVPNRGKRLANGKQMLWQKRLRKRYKGIRNGMVDSKSTIIKVES